MPKLTKRANRFYISRTDGRKDVRTYRLTLILEKHRFKKNYLLLFGT